MSMRKIIFLDIDGVVATGKTIDPDGFWAFDRKCLDNLGYVLSETGAELVITSSARREDRRSTRQHLTERGFPYSACISGITIRAYDHLVHEDAIRIPRGVEIKHWIEHNLDADGYGVWALEKNGVFTRKSLGRTYTYVILDDTIDMLLEQADHFVQCNPDTGLDMEDAQVAIEILNV